MKTDIELLRESQADASICLYMSLDGIEIKCTEDCRGSHTFVLSEHFDFTPDRVKPSVGDKLEGYTVKEQSVDVFSTNWVVYHVETFGSEAPGMTREVVIAWCKQDTATE